MQITTQSGQSIRWEHFECIESTNSYLLENSCYDDFLLVSADSQSKGRGRKQRPWVNTENSLLFSLLTPLHPLKDISSWPITVAITLTQTLSELTSQKLWIKWPNDLYIGNHIINSGKFCGILIETVINSTKGRIITGIGINLAPVTHRLKTDYPISYLSTHLPKKVLLTSLTDALIKAWEGTLTTPIVDPNTFKTYDYLYQKTICATHPNTKKTINGLAKGINQQGHLIIQTPKNIISLSEPHQIRIL